jgi:hypothetical protein
MPTKQVLRGEKGHYVVSTPTWRTSLRASLIAAGYDLLKMRDGIEIPLWGAEHQILEQIRNNNE